METALSSTLINLRTSVLATSNWLSFEQSDDTLIKHQQDKKYSGIQNAFYINKLSYRYTTIQACYTSLIANSIILTIIQSEKVNEDIHRNLILYSTYLLLVNQIIATFSLWVRNTLRNQIANQRKQKPIQKHQSIFQAVSLYLSSYIFLQGIYVNEEVLLNDFLLMIGLFCKIVLLVRGIINIQSKFSNSRAFRISKFYNISNNYLFRLKLIFRNQPLLVSLTLFFTSLFYFSFCVRLIQSNNPNSSFRYFQNCLWFIMQTMITVGYGDILPETSSAKIIGLMGVLSGIVSISLLILSVGIYLTMNNRQQRSLVLLNRLETRKQIKIKAGYVIRYKLWRKWQSYKLNLELKQSSNEKKAIRQFSLAKSCIVNQTQMETGFETFFQQNVEECSSSFSRVKQIQDEVLSIVINHAQLFTGQVLEKVVNKEVEENRKNAQETKQNILFKQAIKQYLGSRTAQKLGQQKASIRVLELQDFSNNIN